MRSPAAPSLLDRWFSLRASGSDVRTEVLAGSTTFLTMAYIIVVNPAIMGAAGMPVTALAIATCLSAAFGTIMMGWYANYPMALAPGMGFNAYFTYTAVIGMGIGWPVALGCVFLSGVAFLLLTVIGVRTLIVEAIPQPLFAAIAASVGLFIGFIGLRSAGIVVADPATIVGMGDLNNATPLLSMFGLVLIAVLEVRRVRASILIGIVATTVLGWLVHVVTINTNWLDPADLAGTAFKLDILGAMGLKGGGIAGILEVTFIFLFVDLVSSVGTTVAVASQTGVVDASGRIPRLNRVFLTDSVATMVGALLGTCTVTTYVESAAGVSSGGRTGLTAVTTGVLFLLALPLAPLVQSVPAAATAPALILVGGMMIRAVADIDWKDPVIAFPSFLIMVVTPLTFSIVDGLAFGIIMHVALLAVCARLTRQHVALCVLAAVFVARFAYLALG